MKIAVMGAGAVGCYYGAMLAQAGHEIILIGRAQHVQAITRHGLLLEKQGRKIQVPMQASTEPADIRGAELILFCVKSADTEIAGLALAPYLAAQAAILSLQNGVDNAERLATLLGREVIPAIVYVGAEMAGPGHVRHHGRGELVLASAPDSARFAAMFTDAGIPTDVSANAVGTLWAKMILNCAYNALSAIARQPYGQLAAAEGVAAVINDLVEECLAIAGRLGVSIPGDIFDDLAQVPRTMPGQFSSTAQDLARGKPSEIDYLNGYIVRKGGELGIPVPANRIMVTLVKLLEARGPEISPVSGSRL